MGRPIKKKYFGNTNSPYQNQASGGVTGTGGESVASVTLSALGSYTVRPTFTFTAPTLPGGVTATGTITSEVLSAAISGSQTRAYPTAAGAIGFNTGGSTFTAAVTSAALTNVVRASATTIGFDFAGPLGVSGHSIHITGASITGTMTIGGVAIAAGQIYYTGTPSTTTAATLYATYADAVSATNPLTIGVGTVTGATFTYGVTYGVVTGLTPVARGSYQALVASGPAVNATYGAGLTITPTYRAKAVVIVEAGSKYTAAPTATPTQSVTFASVALTSTKANAIQFLAKTTSAGTVLSGDIFKQEASRRYLVKTTDGVAQCKLVASDTPAFKEMAIVATDTNGSTYWVLKLTAHKALLSRRTMSESYLFATNTQSGWTLDAATTGKVSINNA
jgi:hypothetical protein